MQIEREDLGTLEASSVQMRRAEHERARRLSKAAREGFRRVRETQCTGQRAAQHIPGFVRREIYAVEHTEAKLVSRKT